MKDPPFPTLSLLRAQFFHFADWFDRFPTFGCWVRRRQVDGITFNMTEGRQFLANHLCTIQHCTNPHDEQV